MIKAIIFDYNGVLVDDLIFHRDAYLKVAEDLHHPLSAKALWDLISATPDEKRVLFGDISDEKWQAIKTLKEDYYFKMLHGARILLPHVEAVLPYLSQSFMLALVSNTARSYYQRVFPSDLANCFRVSLFSGEVHPPKPAPEPILKAMDILGIGPTDCCYIGDAVSDVQMSRAAGVKMFGITSGHHTGRELRAAGADRIIDSLTELADAIKSDEP